MLVRSAILLCTCALLVATACHRSPSADVVATVNGKEILRVDLERYYQASLGENAQQPSQVEADLRRIQILHQVIQDEILQQRAAKENLAASDEDVNARLTEMKAPYTQEEFDNQLKQRNLSLDDLKRDIRRTLTTTKLLNKEIESRINITDSEIKGYYEEHKSEFNLIEPEYHLARIVVSNVPSKEVTNLQGNKAGSEAEAKRKVQMLRSRLDSGESFSSVASNFSEDSQTSANGGDMGFILESPFKTEEPDVFNAVSKLKAGQFTDAMPIYESQTNQHKVVGYGIYELIEKRPAGQGDLTDPRVQQRIRLLLHNNHAQLLQNAYYEMLRDDAKIHNYLAEQLLKDGAH